MKLLITTSLLIMIITITCTEVAIRASSGAILGTKSYLIFNTSIFRVPSWLIRNRDNIKIRVLGSWSHELDKFLEVFLKDGRSTEIDYTLSIHTSWDTERQGLFTLKSTNEHTTFEDLTKTISNMTKRSYTLEENVSFALADFYHFGNFIHTKAPGCVKLNELTPPSPNYLEWNQKKIYNQRENLSDNDFIKSTIGCCDDFGYLTRVSLRMLGTKARKVNIPGHTFAITPKAVVDSSTGTVVFTTSLTHLIENKPRKAALFLSNNHKEYLKRGDETLAVVARRMILGPYPPSNYKVFGYNE